MPTAAADAPDPDALGPPLAAEPARAEAGRARWRRLGPTLPDAGTRAFVAAGEAAPVLGPILPGLLAGSPFLADCLMAEPGLARALAEGGAEAPAAALLGEVEALAAAPGEDRARLMAGLRLARRRAALLAALADLAGLWPLERVTGFLSAFADAAIEAATAHLLGEARRRGEVGADAAGRVPGPFVLGMGKLGARELNYSSDVDLIVLFDQGRLPYRGDEAPMALAVRLARSLAHTLEHRTREGYVFRTDLRLRPHLPGHPLALSTDAAELYYARHGQNWERAAFIKARVVAGDREAGAAFLAALRPYVWRRHLDYAAIRDIHSIKRQIHAHKGFGEVRLLGHDLKVGRGGIREVEFFAQVQQLILGGREPELRAPGTLDALDALVRHRWVDAGAAAELARAYRALRALEHRLQMQEDRQTQALPDTPEGFARFAAFAGEMEPDRLGARILATLRAVERHYAALFESEPGLGLAGGSLVFTGTGDHPATLDTLRGMGFAEPAAAAARIRAWHHGHIRATRSERARELLTELLPAILDALRRRARVDEAFRLFDGFLTALPSGVQIFSLLRANPRLLALLADLVGAAPRLARHLAAHPGLFEAMLQPDFFEALPDRRRLGAELGRRLADAPRRGDLEATLDACRRWAQGRQFQAGLHVLLGASDARDAAAALTGVAEAALAAVLEAVRRPHEAQHGTLPGASFCVLGLGKLGAAELTIGSDLDLVFVYDAGPDAAAASTGPRPLDAPGYHARLAQRLVAALGAATPAGRLFEVDTRLRPSGRVGPVACSLASFERYHATAGETWERQSLVRARAVAGDPGLGARVEAAASREIARPRDRARLAAEVRAMRERVFKEHGSAEPWDVKHARGGLVDLEFAAQFLELAHARAHPSLRTPRTAEAFVRAAAVGLLDAGEAAALCAALALQQAVQTVLRLSGDARFRPAGAPPGLKDALVRAASRLEPDAPPVPGFAALEALLVERQSLARQYFDRLCPPAAAAAAGGG